MPKPHALVLALLLIGLPLTQVIAQSAPEAELLAPQQPLAIRVGRWDPVEETYSSWDTVGGSYVVSTAGTVTLPLVGQVDTTGLTPNQLGSLISDKVQSALGLRGDVQAAVSIAAYAPIYVTGDVGAPGAYPFTPDMNVLQALSLAGGVDRANPALVRGERGALTALGSYRVMELDLLRRLATLARLEAQEADRDIIAPDELAEAPLGHALLAKKNASCNPSVRRLPPASPNSTSLRSCCKSVSPAWIPSPRSVSSSLICLKKSLVRQRASLNAGFPQRRAKETCSAKWPISRSACLRSKRLS